MLTYPQFLGKIRDYGGASLVSLQQTRAILPLIYDAYTRAHEAPGLRVLNIYASHDRSADRESVYDKLFEGARYETIDFWQDHFIQDGTPMGSSYALPHEDNTFDCVITTKIIFEHISEPELTLKEIARVLKPGGEAFLTIPFFRNMHQEPHDYFRYTEWGFRHLAKKAALDVVYVKSGSTGFVTVTNLRLKYGIFRIYSPLHAVTNFFYKRLYMPFAFWLDKFIPDGAKIPQQYLCRVRKPL
jgi:SAM-dependent methyltransferase